MLEPQDRRLLLDSLRPPLGYRLDQAIGTTFTLDLVALLTTPLAFTLFELEESEGRPKADPLALLKATRDYAASLTIFCQAGRIAVPPESQLLYSQLEGSVVEVTAPGGGVFHPKIWLLRYTSAGEPVRFRLLCLSRNLTFDRSWDVCLRLDGMLTKRQNAFAANHPLGDFLAALPRLALRSLSRSRRDAIAAIADEVRRVEFEPPNDFDEIRFHPIGVPRYRRSPFGGDMRRLLVVSPFVDSSGLDAVTGASGGGEHVLVSRAGSLARVLNSDALEAFESLKILDDAAEAELEATAQSREEGEPRQPQEAFDVLRGLHAKLYVAEAGRDSRVWVGSANATGAALHRNVEFMVELTGRSSRCGIDAVLQSPANGVPGFGDLLVDWQREELEVDEIAEELESEAEQIQTALAAMKLVARVDGPDSEGRYEVTLSGRGRGALDLPDDATLLAWLVTQAPSHARPIADHLESLGQLPGIEIEQLTSFIAFKLTVRRERRKHVARFVLNVPLRGAPRGRHDAVLRTILRDRERLLRYLLFILAEVEEAHGLSPDEIRLITASGNGGLGHPVELRLPLLEGLLRALARDPDKLGQVARLLNDLGENGEGDDLLPAGFREVWEPIWTARRSR